jgi:tetratricopeptide (TPR) repeat protein
MAGPGDESAGEKDDSRLAEAGRWFGTGNAAFRQGDLAQAASAYERALQLQPDHADAWLNLGAAYRRLERIEDAAACARRVLELRPDDPRGLNNLANVLAAQGRLEEAARCYRRSLAIRPDDPETYYSLVNLQPLNDGSAESEAAFTHLSLLAQAPDRFTPQDRSALLFALAKALEARGETDRAFETLAQANALHRSTRPFDSAASERLATAICERFDPALFARLQGAGSPSERPVYVVGMPRSGTTLVEQIISAHPEVHGAGEIGVLPRLVSQVRGPGGAGFPFWTEALSAADAGRMAQAYLDAIAPLGPGMARLVDKTVGNFELLGLIHLILPNARIIHCRRDPRDVCVSCFSTRFSGGHDYAYDLAELGRYWRRYDRLMAHWRAVLPPERIFELDYESLVEDLEGWARRLIAHLGLEWDDACLRFYESTREVGTASFVQVRQPIYTASVGRWRRHAARLGPLLEALGDQPSA